MYIQLFILFSIRQLSVIHVFSYLCFCLTYFQDIINVNKCQPNKTQNVGFIPEIRLMEIALRVRTRAKLMSRPFLFSACLTFLSGEVKMKHIHNTHHITAQHHYQQHSQHSTFAQAPHKGRVQPWCWDEVSSQFYSKSRPWKTF